MTDSSPQSNPNAVPGAADVPAAAQGQQQEQRRGGGGGGGLPTPPMSEINEMIGTIAKNPEMMNQFSKLLDPRCKDFASSIDSPFKKSELISFPLPTNAFFLSNVV